MSKRDEQDLIAQLEADKDDPDAWEPDPTPPPTRGRRTLGAQVTIRLQPEFAERLRAMAAERGVGYTTLARQLLEEQLSDEDPWTPAQRRSLDRRFEAHANNVALEQAFRFGALEGQRPR